MACFQVCKAHIAHSCIRCQSCDQARVVSPSISLKADAEEGIGVKDAGSRPDLWACMAKSGGLAPSKHLRFHVWEPDKVVFARKKAWKTWGYSVNDCWRM